VDGVERRFENVWLAPTMHGKYYGGGLMPCPEQSRTDDTLSVMVFHGKCKLQMLMIFSKMSKGEHVKSKKHVSVFKGKEITVKFDEPRTLQIDGETVFNVTEYTARR
jgi:diacylglycerol kinase family enzyme